MVPCHRVVGKDGKLTGYAGGLDRKQILLELEEPSEVRAGEVVLMAATKWQKRVDSADWDAVAAEVNDFGGALLPQLLTAAEAAKRPRPLLRGRTCSARRSTWRRYRFGEGEYRYFQRPYPEPIDALKRGAVPTAAADREGLVEQARPRDAVARRPRRLARHVP